MNGPRRFATVKEYFENRTAAEVQQAYGEQRDEWVTLRMPRRPIVPVVAALIEDEAGRVLLCQRPANKARGLLWEFPGGKVEPDESGPQALARECREELAVELTVGERAAQVIHVYPELTVDLTLYRARIAAGAPQPLEHLALDWAVPEQVAQYRLAPADVRLWEQVQAGKTDENGEPGTVPREINQ